MKIRHWFFVLLIGSLAGAVWATVWVRVTPAWFDRLATVLAVSLMLVPLALSFACGWAFNWWRLRVCLAYGMIVVAWHIAGGLGVQQAHPGKGVTGVLDWISYVADLGLILACWNMGRFLRRCMSGEFGPARGAPADPEPKTENRKL